MHDMPQEFIAAYGAVNRLAARVLAQDSDKMLAELEKVAIGNKTKVKATGGQA
jgi:hypothetical protein